MSGKWVLRIEDKDYAATLEQLRAWVTEGRVQPQFYVFNPTLDRWAYAKEIEELKPQFLAFVQSRQRHGSSICTACGKVGNPITHTKGSIFIELVLWLCFLIPGILYSLWRMTTKEKVCRYCRKASLIPINSPQGQQILARTI